MSVRPDLMRRRDLEEEVELLREEAAGLRAARRAQQHHLHQTETQLRSAQSQLAASSGQAALIQQLQEAAAQNRTWSERALKAEEDLQSKQLLLEVTESLLESVIEERNQLKGSLQEAQKALTSRNFAYEKKSNEAKELRRKLSEAEAEQSRLDITAGDARAEAAAAKLRRKQPSSASSLFWTPLPASQPPSPSSSPPPDTSSEPSSAAGVSQAVSQPPTSASEAAAEPHQTAEPAGDDFQVPRIRKSYKELMLEFHATHRRK